MKALIINDRIAILWIIINLANLQNSLVIYLARVRLNLGSNIAFVLIYKIATMNLMAIAKFFYIIFKIVLLFLFASRYYDKELLELVSIYFNTIKPNSNNIRYLHYLIELKGLLHLLTLYAKI